jgi:hypothetical protein
VVAAVSRSWDFFDTLLGRSTGVDPWRLFDVVGGEEFRAIRQRAEREADEKTLAGIYRQLGRITGWEPADIEPYYRGEFDTELLAAFPIVANARRVQAGDTIVTDTYLTEAQVRLLADRIGLPSDLRIVATYGGKHRGEVWSRFRRGEFEIHTGDNIHADVHVPRRYRVQTQHYDGGGWTALERRLDASGLWAAAAASRAVRLQNPHEPGTAEWSAWEAQAPNAAFLWAAAASVAHYARETGHDRVLYVSRSALALGRIFARLHPEIRSGTFHASRQVYRSPSDSFLAYARDELRPGTLLVDLHGSGASWAAFRQASGVEADCVMVLGVAGFKRRRRMAVPQLSEAASIGDGTSIEVANYALSGRVIDVVGEHVVRDELEYDTALVEIAHAALASVARVAVAKSRPPSWAELSSLSRAACGAVPAGLRRQHVVTHPVTA